MNTKFTYIFGINKIKYQFPYAHNNKNNTQHNKNTRLHAPTHSHTDRKWQFKHTKPNNDKIPIRKKPKQTKTQIKYRMHLKIMQWSMYLSNVIDWTPKTQLVPGAPPTNISAEATSPTTIAVSWQPPPAERSNGQIVYYKVFFVENGLSDSEASVTTLNITEIVLDELKRWTDYKIWVLAGTRIGDGPRSYPFLVRTLEDGM